MTPEPPTAVPLPGLEDYHFVPVQLDQRDRPVYDNEGYHQWGSFRLEGRQAPAKVLLLFDSLTGPLGLNLPELEKDAFQLGELAARVIWLTIFRSGLDKVSLFFRSAMPAKLAQVLLLKDESAALPWPPPKLGAEGWRKEQARFSTMGPSADQGRWRVKLTIEFDGKELPAEFLVVCDHPREDLEVTESSDSPRGAGCLIGPGDIPNSFVITVRPSSLCNYDHIKVLVKAPTMFGVVSVERVFRT